MDQTRKLCEVTFTDVAVGADALLGPVGGGLGAARAACSTAPPSALCAEMCGGAQKVLDMTVEYAKIRQAFGRPIGSYQGVKHKAADMLVDVGEQQVASRTTRRGRWTRTSPKAPLAVSMAKAYVSDAYRASPAPASSSTAASASPGSTTCTSTSSAPRASEFTFGDATYHRERVAQLIQL